MNIISLKNHDVRLAAAHYDVQTSTFCSTAVGKLSAGTTLTAKNCMWCDQIFILHLPQWRMFQNPLKLLPDFMIFHPKKHQSSNFAWIQLGKWIQCFLVIKHVLTFVGFFVAVLPSLTQKLKHSQCSQKCSIVWPSANHRGHNTLSHCVGFYL